MTVYETYLRQQVSGRGVREKDCPRCGGDGFVDYDDGPRMFAIHTCTYCAGRKRVPDYDCDACEDTGIVEWEGGARYCEDCTTGEVASEQDVLGLFTPTAPSKGPEWLHEMRAIARGEYL